MAPEAIQNIYRGEYTQTPRLYPVLLKEPWVNLFVAQALYKLSFGGTSLPTSWKILILPQYLLVVTNTAYNHSLLSLMIWLPGLQVHVHVIGY